ncbi:MAG: diguanylate cyclase [Oleiphilaceae bacterium]|nr:diguanylate cyclase [Oleiphilaceae bacterium]
MAENDEAQFAAKLAQLREGYIQRIRDELEQMNTLEKQARSRIRSGAGAPEAVLGEMRVIAHRLAGSAGTFGFSAMGGRARVLENQLDQVLSQPGDPGALWTEVRKSLSAVHEELRRDMAGAPPKTPLAEPARAVDTQRVARVAVVEDDPHVGEELLLTLEHFGFDVSLYTKPEAAQKAILTRPPDAIILDQHFDNTAQTGTGWIDSLGESLSPRPPLIFISSELDFDTLYQVAEVGGRGYYRKPVDIPQMVTRLEKLLPFRDQQAFRVLIVDDDQPLAEHFQLLLKGQGMAAETLSDPQQLLESLHRFRPDLVLMDLYMPGYSGVTLARLVRLQEEWRTLPIVYLSAETDLDRQLEAMDIGAEDFLTKPISDAHFVASVKVRARRARELNDLLRQDSMTGLLKHALIKEEMGHERMRARREKTPLSVVMLDIDHFKTVNDRYGHGTGDLVICALANLLRQRLRRTDRIGRYGGEEFMAVMPNCDPRQAWEVIDQVRQHFQAIPFASDQGEFFVTLSAGICATTLVAEEDKGDALLGGADQALYQAKSEGRNQVRLAEQGGTSPAA